MKFQFVDMNLLFFINKKTDQDEKNEKKRLCLSLIFISRHFA